MREVKKPKEICFRRKFRCVVDSNGTNHEGLFTGSYGLLFIYFLMTFNSTFGSAF